MNTTTDRVRLFIPDPIDQFVTDQRSAIHWPDNDDPQGWIDTYAALQASADALIELIDEQRKRELWGERTIDLADRFVDSAHLYAVAAGALQQVMRFQEVAGEEGRQIEPADAVESTA